jgi:phosphosulfolactate synthase
MSYAFDFIPFNIKRSMDKPRKVGRTLASEWGLSVSKARDLMEMAGAYMDYVKLAVGSPRFYKADVLKGKLAVYKEFDVKPYLGGQFQEYVFATYGEKAIPKFLAEARDLGFCAAEISENYVLLTSDERRKQIGLLREHGFEVFGEVGTKERMSETSALVGQIDELLSYGATMVLVEGAELIVDGRMRFDLLTAIQNAIPLELVMFELPTVRVGASPDEIHDVKKLLVKEIGPDVNLGNVAPDDVFETECLRHGLGVVGPKARRNIDEQP